MGTKGTGQQAGEGKKFGNVPQPLANARTYLLTYLLHGAESFLRS